MTQFIKERLAFYRGKLHSGISCHNCSGPIRWKRYKCFSCPDLSLCRACKRGGAHPQHDFFHILDPAARFFVDIYFQPTTAVPADLPEDPMLHPYVLCDMCHGLVIGKLFKCTVCTSYNLCTGCKGIAGHHPHSLASFDKPPKCSEAPANNSNHSHFAVSPSVPDGLELRPTPAGEKFRGTLVLHNETSTPLLYEIETTVAASETFAVSRESKMRAVVGPGSLVPVDVSLACATEPAELERTLTVVSAPLVAAPAADQLGPTMNRLIDCGFVRRLTMPLNIALVDVLPEKSVILSWDQGTRTLRSSLNISNLSAKRIVGIRIMHTVREADNENLDSTKPEFALTPNTAKSIDVVLTVPPGSLPDYPRQVFVVAFVLPKEPQSAAELTTLADEKCNGPLSYWTVIDLKIPASVANIVLQQLVNTVGPTPSAPPIAVLPSQLGSDETLLSGSGAYLGFLPSSAVGWTWDLRAEAGTRPKKRKRAGWPYFRPSGFFCVLLSDELLRDKYGADMRWLGRPAGASAPEAWARPPRETSARPGEWALCYHGTDSPNAVDILNHGFALEKSQRSKFGRGIYTTPRQCIAEMYAEEKGLREFNGKMYMILVISRLQPEGIITENGAEYWLVKQPACLRPYGLAIKEYHGD